MLSSHPWQDKKRQKLSCRWCDRSGRQVETVFSSHRCISRLDTIVSKFSVADSLDLSPILFTPPTQQYKTVVTCPSRRCELVLTLQFFLVYIYSIFRSIQRVRSSTCRCRVINSTFWRISNEFLSIINIICIPAVSKKTDVDDQATMFGCLLSLYSSRSRT